MFRSNGKNTARVSRLFPFLLPQFGPFGLRRHRPSLAKRSLLLPHHPSLAARNRRSRVHHLRHPSGPALQALLLPHLHLVPQNLHHRPPLHYVASWFCWLPVIPPVFWLRPFSNIVCYKLSSSLAFFPHCPFFLASIFPVKDILLSASPTCMIKSSTLPG